MNTYTVEVKRGPEVRLSLSVMAPDSVTAAEQHECLCDREAGECVVVKPAIDDAAFVRDLLWNEHPECCGCPVEDTGGEYMGQRETVLSCCGNPEPAPLNDAQIVATLRARFPNV